MQTILRPWRSVLITALDWIRRNELDLGLATNADNQTKTKMNYQVMVIRRYEINNTLYHLTCTIVNKYFYFRTFRIRKSIKYLLAEVISSEEETDRVSVCKLQKHFGTCLTLYIRFYHDSETGTCRKFRYSGCGGNGNNFLSGEDCVRTCGGLLAIDKRLPKLPRIDLAPNLPTGNGAKNNGVSSLPALQSTPNSGSGVSIIAITPRTPRSTTTTSTTTLGIALTRRPILNVNTILPNVIEDSREIREENKSKQSTKSKQTPSSRVRVRKRQRKQKGQNKIGMATT